ncbi:MAG TPA: DUF4242 domain-containing protein [Chitinophagaceae bacterium]|nr:DUF4242 domain-containing protein [Chitinophagaceae bacterium]
MKYIISGRYLLISFLLFAGYASSAQKASEIRALETLNAPNMKTYIIEREIPGIWKSTPVELRNISQTSCKVLKIMGPGIEWVHSYVAGNKTYCIYKAESEELIREHAKKAGFPANLITEISSIISPATAE